MKDKKTFLICIIPIIFILILLVIFAILGSINRIGYLINIKYIENNTYSFKISYYDKVFRNSNIFNVYLDIEKTINNNNFIKDIKMDKNGSPFGTLITDKEMNTDKIENISYKLRIKLSILVLLILSILVLSILFYIIIFLFKNKYGRKKLLICLNTIRFVFVKKNIFIIYTILVILFIINFNIKRTLQLTDLELISESEAGYVYRGKIKNYKDRRLFSIDKNSIKFNNTNNIKYYGYGLNITNKPLGSWYSTNIYYTDNNTFIISNESTNENAYSYNIQVPTYVGDKYKITILAKQLPETGNIFWHLNGYNNFKEITKKEISNNYIVLTDTREIYSPAGGNLDLHFIIPKGVTEIASILIETLNTKLNIDNGYSIFTLKDKLLYTKKIDNIEYYLKIKGVIYLYIIMIYLFSIFLFYGIWIVKENKLMLVYISLLIIIQIFIYLSLYNYFRVVS